MKMDLLSCCFVIADSRAGSDLDIYQRRLPLYDTADSVAVLKHSEVRLYSFYSRVNFIIYWCLVPSFL